MTDHIRNAIGFGNRPEHEGAGYTLDIQLAHGEWLRDVGVVEAGGVKIHSSGDVTGTYRLIGEGDGADLFVNPAQVAQVVVKW